MRQQNNEINVFAMANGGVASGLGFFFLFFVSELSERFVTIVVVSLVLNSSD